MSAKEREAAKSLQYHFDQIQQYMFTLMKENPINDIVISDNYIKNRAG